MHSSRRQKITVILTVAVVLAGLAAALTWSLGRGGSEPGATVSSAPTSPPAAAPGTTPASPGATAGTSSAGPSSGSTAGTQTPATMPVTVYFHRGWLGDPATVVPVRRTVARTTQPATAAVSQLLAGPTAAERAAGYTSGFAATTAGTLRGITVADGVALVDFSDFRASLPGASSSYGSQALLAELDATLTQFPSIHLAVYSFNHDVDAFYAWLQREPPAGYGTGNRAAVTVARAFLVGIGGMTDPGTSVVRTAGARPVRAAVAFRPAAGPGTAAGTGPTTTVTLRRTTAGSWAVTGASTATIRVAAPAPGAAVSSPVAVRGSALAFEGTVNVQVVRAGAGGGGTAVGTGVVMGGGDVLRPFTGSITFSARSGSGWLVFQERSAADGSVTRLTAVPVSFRASVPAA
jgi:hypothetical protein